MGSWPLIFRELRVLARQGQLFWIRVTGATAGFATLAFLLLRQVVVGATLGDQIFGALNAILFFTILFVGPLATCDCIAQEKREGTLGLLFLAPISGRNIVLSKLAINAVRAFSLLLAILPMMALPVVFGGILGQKLFWAILLQITALSIALSAGILASTLYRNFIQAAVIAELYCVGLLVVCGFFLSLAPMVACFAGIMSTVTVVEYCSNALKQKWEEESSEYKEPFWVQIFSTSNTGRAIFSWDTRRARSANPIAWLQEYSWSARLAKWGWLALAILIEVFEMFNWADASPRRAVIEGQRLFALTLVLGMCLAGANSFRQERLSGAMELLLVTPLSPLQIVLGRLWGIWVHFFPAVLAVAFIWLSAGRVLYVNSSEAYILISSYLFAPMIGLYVSLFPWNLLVAWPVIFLSGVAIPAFLAQLVSNSASEALPLTLLTQAILGGTALALLHKKLKNRTFSFN